MKPFYFKALSPLKAKYVIGLLSSVLSFGISSAPYKQSVPILAAKASQHLEELTLETAINAAIQFDPWLQGSQHKQSSLESMSTAAGTLPDPKMSVGIANLAVDTFDFGQEPMTQLKVGVTQMIPRGDSLAIRQRQLKLMASEYPLQRQDRVAKLTVMASQLWLDAYKSQQSIALIEKDRALFEQLADVAQASYASAIGKTRQQDIVRAQLELTRLDDRLTMLKQQKEMHLQRLSEWLSSAFASNYSEFSLQQETSMVPERLQNNLLLSQQMPSISMVFPDLYTSKKVVSSQNLFQYLSAHPSILAMEQRIKASQSGINLAKQQYKPEWGINAGYGYRDDSPLGQERSDFFSVGVSFDIPLFTSNRQDKQLQSAVSKSQAVKTQKWQLVRKMIASFNVSRSRLNRLTERQRLYREKLLPQMHDQAEASLTAYTNDAGDFSEVIRSRISELNASIDSLGIDVERQKSIAQLNYFFTKNKSEIYSE